MTASVVQRSDYRARRPALRRALARRVPCPRCGAAKRKPCTKTGTAIVRITGPHPDRIAAAEAAAERNERS